MTDQERESEESSFAARVWRHTRQRSENVGWLGCSFSLALRCLREALRLRGELDRSAMGWDGWDV